MVMSDNLMEHRIIEAAKTVFMEKGLEATKMQDIADEAGISRTSLNYYYRSKDKLFDMVVEHLITIFAPKLIKSLRRGATFENKIDHLIDEYTELIIENPKYPYFLITEITRNPIQFVEIIKNKIAEVDGFNTLQKELLSTAPEKITEGLDLPQLMLSILSLIITPSLAWPVFNQFASKPIEFEDYMRNRKAQIKSLFKSQINN